MKDWAVAFLAAACLVGMSVWGIKEIVVLFGGFL